MKKWLLLCACLLLMLVPTENLHAETTQSFTLYYTDPEDENGTETTSFTVTGTSKSYVFCSITGDGSHCWVASKDQFTLSGLESLLPIQLYVGYSDGALALGEVTSIDPSVDIKMYITGIGEYSPETTSFDDYIIVESTDTEHLLETLIRHLDTGYSAGFDFSNAKSYKSCTDVEAHITEQWTVTLPTSISLGNSTSKDYSITVKGDVLDESTVTVVPDSSFTMTDLFSRSLTATVAQSESIWTASEINAASGTTHSGTISLESLPAGSWSGNLNFNVGVGFVPGLYTLEGTLSKSWQELLDEGTIHVTDGALTTNFVYDEETGDTSNTSADALVGRLVIPDSVTSLDISAFAYCSNLTSVRIPDSVTSIGNGAFGYCSNLSSVKIPDSIMSIGNGAFGFCSNLSSVKIPDGVASIANSIFCECTSLQSVTIPDSVTSIEEHAFHGCTSLKSVTIPGSVANIGDSAFYGCTSLQSVTLSEGVTSIGQSAFKNCTSLKSLAIPDSVTSIEEYTFYGCTSLQSVTISDSVMSIGDSAFYECTSLQSVTIPDSVTNIGRTAFCRCASLQSVAIPDSVTSIGVGTFGDCISLKSVKIPDSVTNIGDKAFSGCTSLQSVTMPNSVTSIGDDVFYRCTSLQSVTIPDSVTDLGTYAFSRCTNLQDVQLPSSLQSIDYRVFYDCTSLQSVTIPGNIKTIYSSAFEGCENLKSVVFEEGVEEICSSAFEGCYKMETVHIPDSVTSIASMSFEECTGIESISVGSNNIKYDSRDDCNAILETATGKLIMGCKNTNIPEGTVSLASSAFCTSAPNNLYIPASLTNLNASEAFKIREAIDTIIVDPDNSIYDSRNDCNAVIETSSNKLVLGCNNTIIPNTTVSIGYKAFYDCTDLTEMCIPEGVTKVEQMAFYQCSALTSIELPSSLRSVMKYAFRDCTSLSNLDVPSTVTTIYDGAFQNVPNVNYTGSATGSPWGAKSFNGTPAE